MHLGNLFTVRLPVDEVWKALLDVERIAPCVPGAQLTDVAGDEFRGVVKVKVGAAEVEYRGSLRIKEIDEAGRRIVVHATGLESRDQSAASATVTAALVSSHGGTSVSLDTDLFLGGRMAQFGSGVMTDVASALVKHFAERLEVRLATPVAARAAPEAAPITAPVTSPPPEVAAPAPRAGYWLPIGLAGVLATMALTDRRRRRWALAGVGVGLLLAGQRPAGLTRRR